MNMTEMEKMLSGAYYDPSDPELTSRRKNARNTAARFNATTEDQQVLRRILLKGILGGIGEGCELNPNVRFDYGCNVYMGDRCYFNFDTTFLDCAEIRFGNDVFVGPGVSFLTPVHPVLARERNLRQDADGRTYNLEAAKPIRVEDNVWIGGNVTVLPGVTIGHDSVIGAGSVVTRDIPSGVIAVGNPCRVLRPITEEDSVLPPTITE